MLAFATVNALAVGFCIPFDFLAAIQRVVTDNSIARWIKYDALTQCGFPMLGSHDFRDGRVRSYAQ
jgi:hypothetical protein